MVHHYSNNFYFCSIYVNTNLKHWIYYRALGVIFYKLLFGVNKKIDFDKDNSILIESMININEGNKKKLCRNIKF